MVYVALLRGINVGGANKVDMKQLKGVFEAAGMSSVRTFINSGNVVFSTKLRAPARLVTLLERSITQHFGLEIKVQVRDLATMTALVADIPSHWRDDQAMRCYVMFLAPEVDQPSVVHKLSSRPDLEDVVYASGAVIWRIDRKDVNRSGMRNLMGTPLYKQMTIRNCNTTRKLLTLMEEAAAKTGS